MSCADCVLVLSGDAYRHAIRIIGLSDEGHDVVVRLAQFVRWAGRYPGPLKASDAKLPH